MAPTGWVWVARIKRAQGRKGEVFAEVLTDFPQKFGERRRFWLLAGGAAPAGTSPSDPREVELEQHWFHKGGVVLRFIGVESISAAETLSGMIVAIPMAERAQLAQGEAYIGDLIGCRIVDVSGPPSVVGEIEDVDRSMGPVAMLVVRRLPSGDSGTGSDVDTEILIPFAREFLRLVDLEARRVEMTLPEGLVDLNRRQ